MTAKEAIDKLSTYVDMNEPVFILRGRDPLAGMVARIWASLWERERAESGRGTKGFQAYLTAQELDAWPVKKRAD